MRASALRKVSELLNPYAQSPHPPPSPAAREREPDMPLFAYDPLPSRGRGPGRGEGPSGAPSLAGDVASPHDLHPVITNIEDLRELAKRKVPRMFYDYADSGSWTESTYRANEADFQKIKLRQRVAVDIEKRTLETKMIGIDVAMPVALAPIGMLGMQHADGEILAARAAEAFGVPFTLSTMSICSIEDVAANTKSRSGSSST